MSKLPTFPVNKVPYDGPKSFKSITERIAQDAKETGLNISPKNIAFVIQHTFSVRGALNSIPHFVFCSIKRFGRWVPDPKGVKLRKRYYIERARYRQAFSRQLRRNRKYLEETKRLYGEYRNSGAEILLDYETWKKATGRRLKLDQMYRKLNRIRENFMKKEKEKFNYVTINTVNKKRPKR